MVILYLARGMVDGSGLGPLPKVLAFHWVFGLRSDNEAGLTYYLPSTGSTFTCFT